MYKWIIACVLFMDVNAEPVVSRSNRFTNFATENPFDFYQTTMANRPRKGVTVENFMENIDVKKILESLQNLSRPKTQTATSTETTRSLPSTSAIDAIRESDKSKTEDGDDLPSNLATELANLNTAYAKVSDQIKHVHAEIQKNFDVLMKLNILKGMMMEENTRSKGSQLWIKYMSEYENVDKN